MGQPSKGALHDPALWLNDKAIGFEVAAFDDVEAQASFWNRRAQSFSQRRSAIAPIGPKLTQPAVTPQNRWKKLGRSLSVRNVGRSHQHAQDQSEGIDDQMAFSSHDLLARIKATPA